MKFNRTEVWGYILLALVIVTGAILSFADREYYETQYAVEDGLVEYGTALILLLCAVILGKKLLTPGVLKSIKSKFTISVLVVLFVFAAGEEISWGQRIFNVESSTFFQQNNAQKEMNLHNLVVGDTKINKLIFSKILTGILVIYLILLPILYRKVAWIRKITDDFAIPVVKYHHTIVFVLMTIIVTIMPSGKRWEIYEFGFALIFFLIFLFPLNKEVFLQKG